MRRFLNLCAAIMLALLLVLRRDFRAWLEGDRGHARRLRAMFVPALLVLFALLAAGLWALVDAGYVVVALLLLAHVAILLDVAWRPPRD